MTTKTISKFCLLAALCLASVVFYTCKDIDPKPNDKEQTTPTDTTGTTTPIDPIDPTTPIDPVDPKPTDPTTPTNPIDPKPTDPNKTDAGVMINGVIWATRNVDAFGTFAEKPESAGMLYQWNRSKAWNTTDVEVTDWDDTFPQGTTWEKVNDPSPKGWRVPTKEELQSLFDFEKVSCEWTIQNGVKGTKLTDKISGVSLFFPAAGFRDGGDGELIYAGKSCDYWSGTPGNEWSAYRFGFGGVFVALYDVNRTYGYSVRPVFADFK